MSRILKEIHESVSNGYEAGVVGLKTMQKYDKLCMIDSHVMKPDEIHNIRKNIAKVTQPEFAKILGVSPSTIAKWETGNKKPSGLALKILNLIEKKGIDFYLQIFAI
ncbi:MAG: helix-turn-helix domain-containing protein [Gammaproteobacteria bacterium]|nr:helix-turn-helix domain-containing protein [Gammaproteobacteria bacterium]